MSTAIKLTHEYLQHKRVMQLATYANANMWSCNVHFYADESMNLYWMSDISRKHSQQIADSGLASVAIMVHEDTSDEQYVIGVQLSGTAEQVSDVDESIKAAYFDKAGTPPALRANVSGPKSTKKFYKFTPTEAVLFDTKNFSTDPRQPLDLKQ